MATTTTDTSLRTLNNLQNGSRMVRLRVGELPKPLRRVRDNVRAYRRDLEREVLDQHGELGVTAAHHIGVAVAAEQHGAICRWLINKRLDKMSESDISSCSKQMLYAAQERARAVQQLDLDKRPEPPPLRAYIGHQATTEASQASEANQDE